MTQTTPRHIFETAKAPETTTYDELVECLDEAIAGLEWLMENKPKMIDESDHEKLAKWKSAWERRAS